MRKTAFVIEPQELFVDRLRQVLERAGLDVVGVSIDIDLRAIVGTEPNVVFIDTDFLGDDPRDAVLAVNGVAQGAAICVYTQSRGSDVGRACVAAGARCVLSKEATEDEILAALESVLVDGVYADPRVDDGASEEPADPSLIRRRAG
ncbi:MAG: response regulator transcription factor [Candidatus Eremiobacteraeota bacterium]|nr:response regulator transcription factor [Candidatus Eremiobacteraeota bacterium]